MDCWALSSSPEHARRPSKCMGAIEAVWFLDLLTTVGQLGDHGLARSFYCDSPAVSIVPKGLRVCHSAPDQVSTTAPAVIFTVCRQEPGVPGWGQPQAKKHPSPTAHHSGRFLESTLLSLSDAFDKS